MICPNDHPIIPYSRHMAHRPICAGKWDDRIPDDRNCCGDKDRSAASAASVHHGALSGQPRGAATLMSCKRRPTPRRTGQNHALPSGAPSVASVAAARRGRNPPERCDRRRPATTVGADRVEVGGAEDITATTEGQAHSSIFRPLASRSFMNSVSLPCARASQVRVAIANSLADWHRQVFASRSRFAKPGACTSGFIVVRPGRWLLTLCPACACENADWSVRWVGTEWRSR
jgi:hypothetical protein